jgi:hypothetical protein
MSFSFDAKEMMDDLTALSRVGSDFFGPNTVGRVERLVTDLRNAIADAKATGKASFGWRTALGEPLLIRSSRQWKGGTADFDPLSAEIEVSYQCSLRPDDRLLAEGVTVIRIKDPAKVDEEKVFHFDVEVGGWQEMHNGTRRDRAGHPAFHMQFYGMVNDVPRLPSLVVHPVDVISLAILELHQKKWREHLTATRTKSLLRNIPSRQRSRFSATLDGWRQRFDSVDHLPIVGMQAPFREPLAL